MTTAPFILQHQDRRALIWGNRVRLVRLERRRKKKEVEVRVWPDMDKVSTVHAWNAGLLWIKNGYMEIGEIV